MFSLQSHCIICNLMCLFLFQNASLNFTIYNIRIKLKIHLDYLIFVKTFFINLLYYFFVWQTRENDIFFKKLYLFHFFYDKIQL